MLGMHPELIDQVQCAHGHNHLGGHTHDKQGNVKYPAEQKARAGLAQRRAEVVVLALVMRHMRSPQYLPLVAHTMQPVITEIVENEGRNPGRPVIGWQQCDGCVLGYPVIYAATDPERQ